MVARHADLWPSRLASLRRLRNATLGRLILSRTVQNARGNTPIAETFDRDLGLLARDLANPRSAGHAALDFEAQSLGGRLGVGRNGKVDEIDHGDLPVLNLDQGILGRLAQLIER